MNMWTSLYGVIGLASTIGKHGFAAGQQVSKWSENAFYGVRQVVEVNIVRVNVFENLEKAARKVKEFDELAKNKCQEWEQWAEQEYTEAKKQEELNEDWRQNINEKYSLPQPSSFKKFCDIVAEKKRELLPEKRYTLPKQGDIYRPNYLRNILSLY